MSSWCLSNGIHHLVTAPYTSAQNGHAERVHRTILGKARAMRLACNAPPSLWDEFCVTAAYLTNLTATPTLNGKTPYELWYGRRPSLSHLREIGCRAFALVQTNNPKIYRRSTPCVLIGYAPSSKAYRLWDVTTGKVFNSFHVTFIEHLDALPSTLLPGTTAELAPTAPPSWDAGDLIPPSPAAASIPSPVVSPSPPPPPSSSPPLSAPAPYTPPIPSTIPTITITDTAPSSIPPTSGNTVPRSHSLIDSQLLTNDPQSLTIKSQKCTSGQTDCLNRRCSTLTQLG